jgi:hypothetical protein
MSTVDRLKYTSLGIMDWCGSQWLDHFLFSINSVISSEDGLKLDWNQMIACCAWDWVNSSYCSHVFHVVMYKFLAYLSPSMGKYWLSYGMYRTVWL